MRRNVIKNSIMMIEFVVEKEIKNI